MRKISLKLKQGAQYIKKYQFEVKVVSSVGVCSINRGLLNTYKRFLELPDYKITLEHEYGLPICLAYKSEKVD